MKKSTKFYLKYGLDPEQFGFVHHECSDDEDGYWLWSKPRVQSKIYIDCVTRQIIANGSWCTLTVEVMCRLAKADGIEFDYEDEQRPVVMRLTKEEATAIQKMRGHPEEEEMNA